MKLHGLLLLFCMLLATEADSATVQLDGLNAVGIQGVNVVGTLYDVTFEFDSFNDLNAPGTFPFLGNSTVGVQARNAINTALTASGATSVGPSGMTNYYVPYSHDLSTAQNLIGTFVAGSWAGITGGSVMTLDRSYATFSPTVIPVPAAIWLFGSALGVVGLLRRKISA